MPLKFLHLTAVFHVIVGVLSVYLPLPVWVLVVSMEMYSYHNSSCLCINLKGKYTRRVWSMHNLTTLSHQKHGPVKTCFQIILLGRGDMFQMLAM